MGSLTLSLAWEGFGNRRSKSHRAVVWLLTEGCSHHNSFSVSVESLAINFCSPGQRGGFALPSPPGRGQSAESPEWLRGDRRVRGRQVCPCPSLRGSGLSIWRHLGEEDKAGFGELTFSSGLTRKRAHSSILGLAWGQSLLKETTNSQKKPCSPDSCFLKANFRDGSPRGWCPQSLLSFTPCCCSRIDSCGPGRCPNLDGISK